ncbi:hypothetical protein QBC40DRAFT_276485 [Triangularia verruculosa]|uniref:Bromo domain-containing protein n=1 Tax=Triangularia verruculosa TaxID=2587418 RepID=A0AAN7AVB7_9PEZI|nr:hypothetical protein QBC40DRAFT_276485 [Triangularia verruculosa]
MENKRKAGPTGAAENDDRAAKRRKVPRPPHEYDLMKGESPESTTAYGLAFLETIRRTKDKSGRLVASYFENLVPREKNKDYYARIRMPISLKIIERKLVNQDFANMSELESFFKRMVTNAKEYYPKSSEIFEDAERVRKALSNYMTKTNPAYKLIAGYSCTAAPIPDDLGPGELAADAEGGEEAAESEDDAEGDEEEDEGEDEGEEDDDDEDDGNPRKIILKRRGSTNGVKSGPDSARKRDRSGRVKADHEFEGVPYRGLNFQHAQEKIVEELIRKPDEDGGPYFLDFINLPPRSFKDYFAVITSPLSLKGLQKLVKGIHGRQAATGISDFKSWAAFEEKASLLWTNAHFYNEDGSEIHTLATELRAAFYAELNAAKAVVQEPPQQPKIKLKVGSGQETPVLGAKKITIHVGGSKGSVTGSPAPPNNRRESGPLPQQGPITTAASFQLDKSMSLSAAGSPSPSVVAPGPPNTVPRPNGHVPGPMAMMNGQHNYPGPYQGLQNGHPPPAPAPAPPPPLWDNLYRAAGRGIADSLLPSVLVRTHPTVPQDRRFRMEIPADSKLAQQSVTFHLPASHSRLQLIPRLASFEQQGRQYKLMVQINGQMVGRATPIPVPDDPLPPNAMVFDLGLTLGTNIIVVTVVASLPKGQKLENGASAEVERLTMNVHLTRIY